MTQGIKTILYAVKDIAKAKALYSGLLGVAPIKDEPYYVGYRVGDQDIGLNPQFHKDGMVGPVCYWQVDDIKRSLQQLQDDGAQAQQGITEVGGGKLIATVKDPDGNVIGLMQYP